MTQPTLRQLAKKLVDYAREQTDAGNGIEPRLIAVTRRGKPVIINVPFADSYQKDRALELLRLAFAFWEVDAYVIGFEAWVVSKRVDDPGVGELLSGDISKDPGRQEKYSLVGQDRAGSIWGMADIAHYGPEVAIGPVEWAKDTSGMSGGFLNLLPPADLPPPPPDVKAEFFARYPQLRVGLD